MRTIDGIDTGILMLLEESPRETVLGLARRLALARNTVQAHLDRLERRGLLSRTSNRALLEAIGHPILAFTTVEAAQGRLREVVAGLAELPEVLDAHATLGEGDLVCRVAARSAEHLYDVVDKILHIPGVERTRSSLAARELLPLRIDPLLQEWAHGRR
ncbi:MAG TPA: Lrp/AsnC family transcriptional regulator [Mycobacteriales bacterium]|nr:Lrp/AsnC family transcriptional regulator [Mycobacteriales bacterium]